MVDDIKKKILETGMVSDNEFLDKYCELIKNNLNTKKEKYVTNKHHIIPKCYYKIIGQLIITKNNTVNVSYSDHILAHYYLSLCSNNDDFRYCNQLAFMYLVNKTKCDNVRDFEQLSISEKELINALPYYQQIYTEGAKTRGIKNTGKKRSEETKRKMSERQKGVPKSKESIKKRVEKTKGRKKSKEEIEKWKESMKNRSDEEKKLHSKKLSIALKGRVVSKQERMHHSEALKGKPKSDEHKKKLSMLAKERIGGKSPNHKLTEENVITILKRLNNGETVAIISNDYNVSYGCIQDIKTGRNWAYLKGSHPELFEKELEELNEKTN